MELNVFLLSGGTRVPVHVGAVTALLDAGVRINSWAGVSAGSLVASVFASGFSNNDAYQLMLETEYRKFLDLNPVSSVRGMGLYSGRKFESWLNRYLDGRTFRDLEMPLSVVATDVETRAPFVFSKEHTPDITLARAVRCSISLPGIFAAPRVEGRSLIDGCFARISPEDVFPGSPHPSLVVRMQEGEPSAARSSRRLTARRMLFNIADLILSNLKGLHAPELWDHQLRIPVGDSSGINFRLTHDDKQQLYCRGYESTYTILTDIILGTIQRDYARESVLEEILDETSTGFDLTAISNAPPAPASQPVTIGST